MGILLQHLRQTYLGDLARTYILAPQAQMVQAAE